MHSDKTANTKSTKTTDKQNKACQNVEAKVQPTNDHSTQVNRRMPRRGSNGSTLSIKTTKSSTSEPLNDGNNKKRRASLGASKSFSDRSFDAWGSANDLSLSWNPSSKRSSSTGRGKSDSVVLSPSKLESSTPNNKMFKKKSDNVLYKPDRASSNGSAAKPGHNESSRKKGMQKDNPSKLKSTRATDKPPTVVQSPGAKVQSPKFPSTQVKRSMPRRGSTGSSLPNKTTNPLISDRLQDGNNKKRRASMGASKSFSDHSFDAWGSANDLSFAWNPSSKRSSSSTGRGNSDSTVLVGQQCSENLEFSNSPRHRDGKDKLCENDVPHNKVSQDSIVKKETNNPEQTKQSVSALHEVKVIQGEIASQQKMKHQDSMMQPQPNGTTKTSQRMPRRRSTGSSLPNRTTGEMSKLLEDDGTKRKRRASMGAAKSFSDRSFVAWDSVREKSLAYHPSPERSLSSVNSDPEALQGHQVFENEMRKTIPRETANNSHSTGLSVPQHNVVANATNSPTTSQQNGSPLRQAKSMQSSTTNGKNVSENSKKNNDKALQSQSAPQSHRMPRRKSTGSSLPSKMKEESVNASKAGAKGKRRASMGATKSFSDRSMGTWESDKGLSLAWNPRSPSDEGRQSHRATSLSIRKSSTGHQTVQSSSVGTKGATSGKSREKSNSVSKGSVTKSVQDAEKKTAGAISPVLGRTATNANQLHSRPFGSMPGTQPAVSENPTPTFPIRIPGLHFFRKKSSQGALSREVPYPRRMPRRGSFGSLPIEEKKSNEYEASRRVSGKESLGSESKHGTRSIGKVHSGQAVAPKQSTSKTNGANRLKGSSFASPVPRRASLETKQFQESKFGGTKSSRDVTKYKSSGPQKHMGNVSSESKGQRLTNGGPNIAKTISRVFSNDNQSPKETSRPKMRLSIGDRWKPSDSRDALQPRKRVEPAGAERRMPRRGSTGSSTLKSDACLKRPVPSQQPTKYRQTPRRRSLGSLNPQSVKHQDEKELF